MSLSLKFLLVACFLYVVSANSRLNKRATPVEDAATVEEHGRSARLAQAVFEPLAQQTKRTARGDEALASADKEPLENQNVEAEEERRRRDCDSYGHSCWGGHGKK